MATRTKEQWVTDEVWDTLDPKAGAIRIHTKRLVAGVAVLAAATALWLSGLVHPRLAWSYAKGYGAMANVYTKTISADLAIENNGWTDVRVVGVGQDGPGLKLVGIGGTPHISTDAGRTPPFTLHPGQTAIVTLTYQVTDCAAVSADAFDIAVRVERPWGTQTVSVAIPRQATMGSGGGEQQWQRALADAACAGPL